MESDHIFLNGLRDICPNTSAHIFRLYFMLPFKGKTSVYVPASVLLKTSNNFLMRCQWMLELFLAFVLLFPHKTDIVENSCI